MTEVSLFRLYALRAGYLLVAVGLAATVWPIVINHSPQWPLMNSVACSLLAAVSVLAAVGIRYPLQMLPIPLIPWRYVISQYATKPGDRWRRTKGTPSAPAFDDQKPRTAGQLA